MQKHLVVARYQEDPSWISSVDVDHIFLYEKHDSYKKSLSKTTQIPLPNIGRESHSYIHHIIENYDSLADCNIFVQGKPFDHCQNLVEIVNQPNLTEMWNENNKINKCDVLNYEGYLGIGKFSVFDMGEQAIHCPRRFKIMNKIWRLGKINTPFPDLFPHSYGAIFVATSNAIRRQEIQLWGLLKEMHYIYREIPWAMELLWPCIFDPKYQFNFPRLLL